MTIGLMNSMSSLCWPVVGPYSVRYADVGPVMTSARGSSMLETMLVWKIKNVKNKKSGNRAYFKLI